MDHIKKAIELAKGPHAADTQSQLQPGLGSPQPQFWIDANIAGPAQSSSTPVMLNGEHLESNRIISHDIADPRSKSFDMLRTQVLQSMDTKSWQLLAVTSPTEGCGKTTIAVNLALSIARQQDRSVLLVDMDLHKPQIANTLGLKCDQGLISVLEGRTNLSNVLIPARIRNERILVLPCESSTLNSSELMASRSMSAVFQEIKRDFKGWIVILDLPPILSSDDAILILPRIDCALFVTMAGTTTLQEIKDCNKHLEATPIVRVVVNKSSDPAAQYYSQYANIPVSQAKTNRKSDGKRSRS